MARESEQTTLVPKSEQLKELVEALTKAKTLYGSAKTYARLAIEDPSQAVLAAQAAKALTEGLRQIQALS